jgi:hydrogenase-1 operon protein HyaF
MPLERIPVVAAAQWAVSGNARPLLHEIAAQLRRLLDAGEAASIDLSALPLNPADRDWLRERLGSGEVSITLDAEGESTLAETAFPGVWWVTHRNQRGDVLCELIEIAFVPYLVGAPRDDVATGLERLELALSEPNDEPGGRNP